MNKPPIYDIINDIKKSLINNSKVILQAPTGAGKSTAVPLSLINEPYVENKIILMLEPRRVAARMVASFMSKILNESVGNRVGYQIKLDSKKSSKTKILVVTEAILIKMLQDDQALENIGLIIFDEFHERSINTDLCLALSLQSQELLRNDIKLLIMSATLEQNELQTLLPDAAVLSSKGKSFNVSTIYLEKNIKQPSSKNIQILLYETILKAISEEKGDILVFLPGIKEIRYLQEALKKLNFDEIIITPLYSSLNKEEQNTAILKNRQRKIILSTNVAQTSLTIEGVCVVIDSGLEKLSFYKYSNAMDYLELSFISKASSIQREGRAGRLQDGVCYKLWHKDKILQDNTIPEILRADLSTLILNLALWGVEDLQELKWLDIPSLNKQKEAKLLLQELKMLDKNFHITSFGRDALKLGLHPRFAYMILKANNLGCSYSACLLASLLSNKDIYKSKDNSCDILPRFTSLFKNEKNSFFINKNIFKEVLFQKDSLLNNLKKIKNSENITKKDSNINIEMLSILLLYAYPDRLGKKRDKKQNKYILSNNKEVVLRNDDDLFNEEFLICPTLYSYEKKSFISLALPISLTLVEKYFDYLIVSKEKITFNKESEKFEVRKESFFLELLLYSKIVKKPSKTTYKELFLRLIKEEGLSLLEFNKKTKALQDRVNFINFHKVEYSLLFNCRSFEDKFLLEDIDLWLSPYLENISTLKELRNLDFYTILLNTITFSNQKLLNELAPKALKVPSGSYIKLEYSKKDTIVLNVRIQEIFGLKETPLILNKIFLLQLHLLTPALRPIQITNDLSSFWKNSYLEVRKELRGKYKRHYWPENPLEAQATNKTKKNMK